MSEESGRRGRRSRHPAPWPSATAMTRLLGAITAWPRGLLCDVDGTLSPIAPSPDQARLLPGAREALLAAGQVFDVAGVVTGRDPRDVWRLIGARGLTYIGNHGFERLTVGPDGAPVVETAPAGAPWREPVAAALEELRVELGPRLPGAIFEAKGVTASVHVRQTADPAAAEVEAAAVAERAAERHGLRLTRGRLVLELRPPVPMDKGVAVADLCRERGLRGAIYLGDDRTDIDAFRALRGLGQEAPGFHGVSVAVLHDEAPPELAREADVTLASIGSVIQVLQWVIGKAAETARRG